jgi:hypothetical protein
MIRPNNFQKENKKTKDQRILENVTKLGSSLHDRPTNQPTHQMCLCYPKNPFLEWHVLETKSKSRPTSAANDKFDHGTICKPKIPSVATFSGGGGAGGVGRGSMSQRICTSK